MNDLCEACGLNIAKVEEVWWNSPYIVNLLKCSDGGDCPDHADGLTVGEVEEMTGVNPLLEEGCSDEVDSVALLCYACSIGAEQAKARGLKDEAADFTDIAAVTNEANAENEAEIDDVG